MKKTQKSFTYKGIDVEYVDGVEIPYFVIYFDGEFPTQANTSKEAKRIIKDRI